MLELKTVDDVIEYAIGAEERAYNLYMSLYNIADNDAAKKALKEFAEEELKHKAILEGFKSGEVHASTRAKQVDLKLAETLGDAYGEADMTYQEALVIGMKAEKAAYDLYTALADQVDDEGLRKTLLVIADEEMKHKAKFESEYEKNVLKEN
jgi:rubrerythrin